VRVEAWRFPLLAATCALLLFGSGAHAQSSREVLAPRAISVIARAIDSFDNRDPPRTRFGALEFRGGLELTSTDAAFGGLSGLTITPDGSGLLSISDRGTWFRGRIVYRDNRAARIESAEIAPMLDLAGTPLAQTRRYDTESLTEVGGKHCVGIERVNEIVCFDYRKDGFLARGQPIAVPPAVKTLPRGKGLEALAGVPAGQELAGALIAISERGLDSAGNIIGVMIGGPRPGQFAVRRYRDYDITDAALLPGGDVLILERSFSFVSGVGMRIRRVPQSAFKPGAVIEGRALIEADLGYQIDNMEGIAAHRAPNGDTIVNLISDDNFSVIQRTLLLQFALVGE
jgi:hypothetical protein